MKNSPKLKFSQFRCNQGSSMSQKRNPQPYNPIRGRFAGRTFKTTHAYRNALARAKGYRNEYARRIAYESVSSRKSLEKLPLVSRYKREDALQVLSIMRRQDKSLSASIKEFNASNPSTRISSKTVKKYVKPALQREGGRLRPKPYDRLLRVMKLPTRQGMIDIEVRDSRSASRIASYMNAVKTYLHTGDDSQLRRFRGKYIQSNKLQYRFIIDTETLNMLAEFGEFRFESIYEELSAT
jgi:hypothetical protein